MASGSVNTARSQTSARSPTRASNGDAADPTLVSATGQLAGARWPLRVAPAPDEVLTSWISRLAARHGATSRTLVAAATTAPLVAGGKAPHHTLDLDRTPPDALLEMLAAKTDTPPEVVAATRLCYAHLDHMLDDWILALTNEWLGPPVAVNWVWPERRSTAWCPHCLAEDADPYIRRAWRVGCVTVCARHGVQLIDACPDLGCNARLVLPGMGTRAADGQSCAAICERCGAVRTSMPTSPATARDIDAQRVMDAALAGHDITLSGLGTLAARDYVMALNTIVQLLTAGQSAADLRPMLTEAAGLAQDIPPSWGRLHVKRPNHLLLEERRYAVTLATWVLSDWPRSFADTLLSLDLWRSDHIWRPQPERLWAAVRTYYETEHLAACPPSFRPRRPYTSPWEL